MRNDDYIKRSDFTKAIEAWLMNDEDSRSLQRMLEDIPAADVEPARHGRWIRGDRFEYDGHGETVRHPGGITCSQCRYGFAKKHLWSRDYCPHCGARMDQDDNE